MKDCCRKGVKIGKFEIREFYVEICFNRFREMGLIDKKYLWLNVKDLI
ncbi:MAG: hypothetical protein ACE5KT_00320 [Methanosarcinales archaeon]